MSLSITRLPGTGLPEDVMLLEPRTSQVPPHEVDEALEFRIGRGRSYLDGESGKS